jgi:hypothetical protein
MDNNQTVGTLENGSVWERELYALLSNHARVEGAMLETYVELADASESNAFKYLIRLLVDDERRHHRQFNDLADSVRAGATLLGDDPVVPRPDFKHADRAAILEITRRLIENEESDAAELKRLRKDIRDLEDSTLWTVLVDSMRQDTEKHLSILRYIEHQVKG